MPEDYSDLNALLTDRIPDPATELEPRPMYAALLALRASIGAGATLEYAVGWRGVAAVVVGCLLVAQNQLNAGLRRKKPSRLVCDQRECYTVTRPKGFIRGDYDAGTKRKV